VIPKLGVPLNKQVNITKRVKTKSGLRYCPVVLASNGRVKPDFVLVDGKEARHPDPLGLNVDACGGAHNHCGNNGGGNGGGDDFDDGGGDGFCDASGNCSGLFDQWDNGGKGGYVGGIGSGPGGVPYDFEPGYLMQASSPLAVLQSGVSRYLSIIKTGWDPALGINLNYVLLPQYLSQANGQYDRLSENLSYIFGPGVSADSTDCDLIGGHCNFLLSCDPTQSVCPSPGRYDDGIHIENVDGALWVHDDTVSPWTGDFSASAFFTANFWEHGFVDLIGGTFFIGAFPQ
jgi:hypothetical protein